ncbi:hypothetical protein [Pseudocnuella soli]|uniref:hypothetical protein n=1 Tax=Pseudocnuella soli TaxID=2502779 RepID=UPI0010453D20|nr:hypothetical protein [Pseudocnuella soli]
MNKIYRSAILLFCLATYMQNTQAQNATFTSATVRTSAASLPVATQPSREALVPQVSLRSANDAQSILRPASGLLVYNTNAALSGGSGYYYNSGTPTAPVWAKLVAPNVDEAAAAAPAEPELFPMGELSMTSNVVPTDISASGVYHKVAGGTQFTGKAYSFASAEANTLTYTGSVTKMFHISCTLAAFSAEPNQVLKAVVYKNGKPLSAGTIQTKLGDSNEVTSTAIQVMTPLSKGDSLEVRVMNLSSHSNITVTDMNLFAMGVSMGIK